MTSCYTNSKYFGKSSHRSLPRLWKFQLPSFGMSWFWKFYTSDLYSLKRTALSPWKNGGKGRRSLPFRNLAYFQGRCVCCREDFLLSLAVIEHLFLTQLPLPPEMFHQRFILCQRSLPSSELILLMPDIPKPGLYKLHNPPQINHRIKYPTYQQFPTPPSKKTTGHQRHQRYWCCLGSVDHCWWTLCLHDSLGVEWR